MSDVIQNGISICRLGESGEYIFEPDFSDNNGYGTAITALLSVICPDSPLVAVRIAQQGIRLVNVSYSIEEVSENSILVDVCKKIKNTMSLSLPLTAITR